jgi:fucose permease
VKPARLSAHVLLLGLIYLAFISLGLPDSVLGVAWPAMRGEFGRSLEDAGLLMMILTTCSALSGFASGFVLGRLGTGKVVAISGFMTGLALLGFALAPGFHWIVCWVIPLGLGAGSVDAGVNHFVARHYSARHMNWLHGCWGIGATIGPVVMGAALANRFGWQGGYAVIAAIQLALALLFLRNLRLWQAEPETVDTTDASADAGRKTAHVRVPAWASWLAPALYMAYTTIELGTGLWAASILIEGRGADPARAGLWVAGFFGAIMVGRFAIGLVANRLGNRLLVRTGIAVALCGALLFAIPGLPDAVNLAGLMLMGLGCAPIYPSLMHEATRRFDADTARTVIGRQVAFAYVGCALGPAALGMLGAHLGVAAIMPAIALVLLALFYMNWKLDQVT